MRRSRPIKDVVRPHPKRPPRKLQVTSSSKGQTSGKKMKKNKTGGQGECDAATQAANIAKLKGRCFTCAGEHATKDCSYPCTVQCNKCKKPGHLGRCCIKSRPITLPERARQVHDEDREESSSRQDLADAQANAVTHWAATPTDWSAEVNAVSHHPTDWVYYGHTHYARRARTPHMQI